MRIAFFSFEFPEETGGGGIGTYLKQAVILLRSKGNEAVVFTATRKSEAFWENEFIFRIPASNWKEFNLILPQYFLPVHEKNPFDVAEGSDFNGCGLFVKMKLMKLAFVARLHTPLYMVDRLQYQPLSLYQKMRFVLGGLKKGRFHSLPRAPDKNNYADEFSLLKMADRISSPSTSIYRELSALGFDIEGKTDIIPLPFQIPDRLLSIKSRLDIHNKPHIVFIGRLEIRKGVIELAKAIPEVLNKFPSAHFTFAGESSFSPDTGRNMEEYLKDILFHSINSVTFTGRIKNDQVYEYLDKGDIFVFPSHYESFGLACCEAMAAGKAVVAGNRGGMSEIIVDGKSGVLVSPGKSDALSSAIISIINDNAKRVAIGEMARTRIMEYLDEKQILEKQIVCYQKAIQSIE